VAVGSIGGGLLEALGSCPEVELVAPSFVPAGIATALPQEEALHPVLGLAAVVLDVFAHTDEVADRLLGRGRHPDRGELAGPVQTCQVAGVDPVGLHAGARPTGDHGGSDHVAGHAE